MTSTTPKQIAAKLTKAQRETVMRKPYLDAERNPVWNYRRTMDVLHRMRLLEDYRPNQSGWAMLSPLGIAVRAILQKPDND